MDDLSGLTWSSNNNSSATNKPSSTFPTLRPTPSPSASGRSTPLSAQASGRAQPTPPLANKPDSFSGLLGTNKAKQANNVSLQERQKQLLAEKAEKEADRRRQLAAESSMWDSLGSGKSTPDPQLAGAPQTKPPAASQPDDDILAAFNSSAPVNTASHLQRPDPSPSRSPIPPSTGSAVRPNSLQAGGLAEDDDDPFGLGQMNSGGSKPSQYSPNNSSAATTTARGDDDDILGMLGKPVSEVRRQSPPKPTPQEDSSSDDEPPIKLRDSAEDKAVADLVDMGFPADKAAWALAQTQNGTDLQGAVGILLNQAHDQAKQKSKGRQQSQAGEVSGQVRDRQVLREERDGRMPSSSRRNSARPSQPSTEDNSGSTGEADVAKMATEIGASFLKSANSLWKTGQKKVQRAVADLQQDNDPSVPKWMRSDSQSEGSAEAPRQMAGNARKGSQEQSSRTNEAMLLDSGDARPSRRPAAPTRGSDSDSRFSDTSTSSRSQRTQPQFLQDQARQATRSPLARVSRHDVEEESAQAYVSPARRKRTSPKRPSPERTESPAGQPDLFQFDRQATKPSPSQGLSNNPFASKTAPAARSTNAASKPPAPRPAAPPRPKAPPRQIPPVSASSLSASASHRKKGTEAYKRGDFGTAHAAYSSALSPLPPTHPVAIVVLCNRALTGIKTGEPKAAISDAENALGIIGPSQGDGETITIGDETGKEELKEMKEFFGKALMRKAEALEHMEKWAEAGKTWQRAVEAGVGGSVAIQGRNRCENATRPKPAPKPAAARPRAAAAAPKPSALGDLAGGAASGESAVAVQKLQQANAAAEKLDNERFALTDAVDARLVEWKGTKADNLRALLGSLDKVLWPEAGWKKVGMSDLVMVNKVKIVYMKAIAKVHPDKLSQTSTTEQKMISAAVFSTLNDAWEKFKKDNNL